MPSWLGGMFFKWLLDWVLGQLKALYNAYQKDKANHETAVNQAAQDMKKAKEIKPESSEKEVDDAIDDSLKHL
jgi:hypothetical protein